MYVLATLHVGLWNMTFRAWLFYDNTCFLIPVLKICLTVSCNLFLSLDCALADTMKICKVTQNAILAMTVISNRLIFMVGQDMLVLV